MTPTELRELNDADLVGRLAEAKRDLFQLRFDNATGALENSARIKQVKKDVARIYTVLREREIEAAEHLAGPEEG